MSDNTHAHHRLNRQDVGNGKNPRCFACKAVCFQPIPRKFQRSDDALRRLACTAKVDDLDLFLACNRSLQLFAQVVRLRNKNVCLYYMRTYIRLSSEICSSS